MKKTKTVRVRKPKATQIHNCNCMYDHRIAATFDESFLNCIKDGSDYERYANALNHSQAFNALLDSTQDVSSDGMQILVDSIRAGFLAGKRMAEISNLESMVGL